MVLVFGIQKKENWSRKSHYLGAIWSFLVIKWGFSICWNSWRYMMKLNDKPSSIKIKFPYACLGAFIGFSVALMFGFHYQNYETALWGLISGIFATLTAFEHMYRYKKRKSNIPISFPHTVVFVWLGAVGFVVAVVGFIFYITYAATFHQPVNPKTDWVKAVWCFMTMKWSISLCWNARVYQLQDRHAQIKMLTVNEDETQSLLNRK